MLEDVVPNEILRVQLEVQEEDAAPNEIHPVPVQMQQEDAASGVQGLATGVQGLASVMQGLASQMVQVVCADGSHLDVPVLMLTQAGLFKNMLKSLPPHSEIPLVDMRSAAVEKILRYWTEHLGEDDNEDPQRKDALAAWDQGFVKMEPDLQLEVLVAAHYFNMEKLENLLARRVANHISKMTVEQVREYFGIESDFTPEQEAKIREQNKWAYD